jgi:hypothetical protein
MKKVFRLLPLMAISFLCLNFKTSPHQDIVKKDITKDSTDQYLIRVHFEYGEDFVPTRNPNIYVIWMEDSTTGFLQNMKICYKLIHGGLTGTALPYWKVNKYPLSSPPEVDAVTSATIANSDFYVTSILKDSTIRKFTLNFEIDRSFDPNDWFSDQPALLYSTHINIDSALTYELTFFGWTPNENTQNIIPFTPMGVLQFEKRYITHHKVDNTFGGPDVNAATIMVERITITVIKPVVSVPKEISTDNYSISLYPNPTYGKVNIKCEEIMNELVINNIKGQPILHLYPKTCETSFILDKSFAPAGLYYAMVSTSKGMIAHKILLIE